MAVSELDIAPRTKGRASSALSAEFVRDLASSDLALLASERGIKPPALIRIRDRHHALARVLAQGMTSSEASAITGYDPSRISILKADPAFRELIENYKTIDNALQADFQERAAMLSLTAMNNLQEMLEDDENPLPAQTQLEISKTFADRTGHAPVVKTQNTNVNIDLGTRLKSARERAQRQIEGPVIDAEFSPISPGGA